MWCAIPCSQVGSQGIIYLELLFPLPPWSLGTEVPPIADGNQREWVKEETIRYQKDEKTL